MASHSLHLGWKTFRRSMTVCEQRGMVHPTADHDGVTTAVFDDTCENLIQLAQRSAVTLNPPVPGLARSSVAEVIEQAMPLRCSKALIHLPFSQSAGAA